MPRVVALLGTLLLAGAHAQRCELLDCGPESWPRRASTLAHSPRPPHACVGRLRGFKLSAIDPLPSNQALNLQSFFPANARPLQDQPSTGAFLDASAHVLAGDVVYRAGESDATSFGLDVWGPAGGVAHPVPVMIYVHGGAWRVGDKARVHSKADFFAQQGWLFVSVNYRLDASPDVQAHDVAAAVAWVHDRIHEFGGDPRSVFLMGHSAGAHLAAAVATGEEYLGGLGLAPSVIRGVVLLDSAAYDIPLQISKLGDANSVRTLTSVFGWDQAFWAQMSPTLRVSSATPVPPTVAFYIEGRRASQVQAERLAAAIRSSGGVAHALQANGKSHSTINHEFGLQGDQVTADSWDFISSWLAQ